MMEIKVVSAQEIESYIDIIANLRITIFKEYPYLYDGDYTYEQKYLKKFLETPDSLICVAYDENQIVGAITALPLKYEDELIKKPFLNQGISMDTVYYYSEALILQEYRKKGLELKCLKWRKRKLFRWKNTPFLLLQPSNAMKTIHKSQKTTNRPTLFSEKLDLYKEEI